MRAPLKKAKKDAWNAFEECEDRKSAVNYLKALGYKQLGRGLFAVVLAHPDCPNQAIRVGRISNNRDGYRQLQDGFPGYAQAIINGWLKSPYTPKVYAIHWAPDLTVSVVERLYRCTDHKFKRRAYSTTQKCRWPTIQFNNPYKPFTGKVLAIVENIAQYGQLDLGGGNIMQRKSGHPVFMDPLTT